MAKKAEEKQQVNDLIFKELIKRGYSLEGNTRVWNIADSKLWYLTPEQAQAFLNLEESKDYQKEVIQKEVDLIKENIKEISSKIADKNINMIDLGCGDGKKAVLFIDELKDKFKIRYCPIDISNYMVEKALSNIQKDDVEEVVKVQWNISDFENVQNITSLLRYKGFKENLILLLGNTLGNFEINELLYEVRSAMKDGDVLVIGNGLDNRHPDEILKAYDNNQLNNLLIKTLNQLGIADKDVEYGVRFKNSRIEMYYSLKKDCTVEFLGKEVRFSKGDQIIVAVSYKYDKKDFMAFLKMYFEDVTLEISEDKSYALAICKK